MLAQQGRLAIEDRITKWFPEGRGVWDSITVRRLLTHTSGMPEYTDSLIDLRKDYTEDQLVRLAASRPLDFRPGETERTVFTVYYTEDWRAAYFDYENY